MNQEILNARIYINQKIDQKYKRDKECLEIYGRKVYSQTDEDGILEEILRRIKQEKDITFIEIGVGSGTENNTLKLLGEGAKGIWIEGNEKKAKTASSLTKNFIKEEKLQVIYNMVDTENADKVIKRSKDFLRTTTPTVLSIDIDGPDHLIVKKLLENELFRPKVIIVEYNGRLSAESDLVDDYTNCSEENTKKLNKEMLYGTGASLKKWVNILDEYKLVGCGILGINAFFVREEEAKKGEFPDRNIKVIYNYFDPLPWCFGGYKQMHGYPSKFAIYD